MSRTKPELDLQAQDRHRKLLEAQQAVEQGRVPFVHPAVTDPRAISHALGAEARNARREQEANLPGSIKQHLPKYRTEVAGGSAPPMPALEADAVKGQTMAAQATSSRARGDGEAVRRAMSEHAKRPESIISSERGPGVPQRPGPLLLQPNDILPQEALKDPTFQHGAGSMLAQLQPHMAQKYGVIRSGQFISPQQLQDMGRPAPAQAPQDFRSNMRRPPEETARDLRAALQATAAGRPAPAPAEDNAPPPPRGMPKTDEEAEEQAAKGPGGAAARTGKSPNPIGVDDEDEKAMQEALSSLGDLDVDALRREMMRDILKNPRQREIIEARIKPFGPEDLATLLETNHLRQRVPIVPGVFEPTFETMDQDVEFRLKQLLMIESESVNVTNAYLLDKYAVMTTTAGTIAINNNPLPSMYDERGDFKDELFWKKFNWMIRKPLHMLASLGIHYAWFEARARKLFKVDTVKNG